MQVAWSRIGTRVAELISYEDNHNTMSVLFMYIIAHKYLKKTFFESLSF